VLWLFVGESQLMVTSSKKQVSKYRVIEAESPEPRADSTVLPVEHPLCVPSISGRQFDDVVCIQRVLSVIKCC